MCISRMLTPGAVGPERPVVIFSERLGSITAHERRIEAEAGAELRRASLWSADEILANAAQADALLVGAVEPLTGAVLERLPRCQLIVRRGVGYDNVDVAAATELGIAVAYVPDASVEEVSDHALALLLALERKVLPLDRFIKGGAWVRGSDAIAAQRRGVRRLCTLTLGVVGFGRIGRALARKARPIFAERLVSDPYVTPEAAAEHGATLVPFEALVERADLVSVHAPLTPETTHLFNADVLARMKPSSYLVNTARGPLVDEAALVEALRSGRLAGAALDVTEREPLGPESPLFGLDNLILTGHSAALSESASEDLARRSVEAVIRGLRGQRPPALVNPEVLDQPRCRLRLSDASQQSAREE